MKSSKSQFPYPSAENHFLSQHVSLLNDSFHRFLGYPIMESKYLPKQKLTDDEMTRHMAESIFQAPFVLISHGTQTDPVFNYANFNALQLFAMQWEEFTQMPSRYSAEAPNREERARLLAEVEKNGYIADYQGIRIAKNGQRFLIEQAIVWNVIDSQGNYFGQAAYFDHWKAL